MIVKKLHPNAVIPKYAHGCEEDAGMDLVSVESKLLMPNVPTIVGTGIAIALPPLVEGQIRPRSGLAAKYGLTVANSPGTIDPSYRGEVKVILLWGGYFRQKDVDEEQVVFGADLKMNPTWMFKVEPGMRIAQLVIAPYIGAYITEADELPDSTRGANGLGSSGMSV